MNTRTLIAASLLALAAAPAAFAQSAASPEPVTRAGVVAELQRARAAGELEPGVAYGYSGMQTPESALSRAAVVAELARARNAGELRYVNTPESGYPWAAAQTASTKTRAEVRAEVQAAARAGTLRTAGDRS